ncbi:thioredoxin domain-containing 9-like protein [Micractinium conductrix]|uniref:Thioredoxin domain-containing 9-like protein n=1 Tax=Micractinium conductrix TaxID=554055 RepID=A0A2P6V6A5_9CHLO|nr:thioredoxin domain-containing 9-like protein [Micractinium conductrix]|eukprot:PSC69616.1 thioredoxin domain-containing 9-like protein [Micractinium conductrix]
MAADPCCPPETAAWAAEAEFCSAASLDPTLEACCQRDLEAAALEARLKAQLSLHDRSKERERAAARVFGGDAAAAAAAAAQHQQLVEDQLGSGDDDALMGRLREARLRELRTAADARSEAQRAGHGTLGDVPEAGLLRAAQQAAPAPFVAHLALDGSPLDDDLDEHLTTLAARYLGTRFVRSRIALHSTLHLRLRTPPGPGLLCFREGSLVGAAPLDRFGAPECILEEEVDKWLRKLQVLVLQPGGGAAAAAATAAGRRDGGGGDSGSEEEAGGEWEQPCEVCGRRYPHQHIRSAYAGGAHDSDGSESE